MPVHFNSILNKEKESKVLEKILSYNLDHPDDVFVPQTKDRFLIINNIIDKKTNNIIGRTTITFITRNNAHELIDIDITLINKHNNKLIFEEKYSSSSEGNEYYHVTYDNIHFNIETVGRYRIEEELEGTERNVSLSAFPFKLNIFKSIEDANRFLGFKKQISTPIKELKVDGFSEDFMGVGSIGNDNSFYSLVIGKIKSFNDVEAVISGEKIKFTIIEIETAVGILPVAVNKDNFNIRGIKEDMILVMFADIKAEF